MKLSSFRYLTREGLRNIWQNRFMAIASIAVLVACLLLTGSAYLALANVESAFDWIYAQNQVAVFAAVDATEEQVNALGDSLRGLDNVRDVVKHSKEETLEKFKDSLAEETYESLQGDANPMPDSYIVTFHDLSRFDETVAQIETLEHVDEISIAGGIAEMLVTVRRIVLTVGVWVVALLLVVSLFIIANTIKLTVYNRRLEIYIMRSVGATGAFIRIPFVIEGMVLGLISATLSYGIVWFLYSKLRELFPPTLDGLGLLPFADVWMYLLIGFAAIGILTGMIGSFIATGKYLHKEGSEKA